MQMYNITWFALLSTRTYPVIEWQYRRIEMIHVNNNTMHSIRMKVVIFIKAIYGHVKLE